MISSADLSLELPPVLRSCTDVVLLPVNVRSYRGDCWNSQVDQIAKRNLIIAISMVLILRSPISL